MNVVLDSADRVITQAGRLLRELNHLSYFFDGDIPDLCSWIKTVQEIANCTPAVVHGNSHALLIDGTAVAPQAVQPAAESANLSPVVPGALGDESARPSEADDKNSGADPDPRRDLFSSRRGERHDS